MTKILLVEDDKSLREIYGVRLLAEGYDIVSAGDGEEALAMAIKEKPQLIISDVMMPKISGFDMLDILHSTTETKGIKVIMMTALSSDDQRARGELLGADRYLVKSQVGIEDVVRTVHEVLGDSSASDTSPATADTSTTAVNPTAPGQTQVVNTPGTVDNQAASATPVSTTTETVASAPPVNPDTSVLAAPGNDDAGPLPPQPSEIQPEQPSTTETTPPTPVESAPSEEVTTTVSSPGEAPSLSPVAENNDNDSSGATDATPQPEQAQTPETVTPDSTESDHQLDLNPDNTSAPAPNEEVGLNLDVTDEAEVPTETPELTPVEDAQTPTAESSQTVETADETSAPAAQTEEDTSQPTDDTAASNL